MKRCIWFAVIACAACSSSFDDARAPVDTGSFGNTVVTLACKRIAYLESVAAYERGDAATIDVDGERYRAVCREGLAPPETAPGPLKALQARRDPLVDAVDATFPDGFLPQLQDFLTTGEFLTLYDDGTTEQSIDHVIKLLDLMADDAGFAEALARFNLRDGYLPLDPSLSALRSVMQYPQLHELTLSVLEAVTVGGSARVEFDNMIAALSAALRNAAASDDPAADDRSGRLALRLLFGESDLLGTDRELLLVERDGRGLARVATIGGALPEPFADTDADGLADADAIGRYIDAAGAAILAPQPFSADPPAPTRWPRDDSGRALIEEGGALLYDYVDLDRSVIGALTRDALQLVDPSKGTAFDLLRGASLLAGPRVMTTHDYDDGPLPYRGYDTADSPLLDLAYGYLTLLDDANIYDTLGFARTLLRDHPAAASRVLEAFVDAARTADRFPDAVLEPDSPLFDDLMPTVQQILATPGLAEDLLRALERPEVVELGKRFAEQMSHNDRISIDPDTQELIGGFATAVDRSRSDSAYDRSLFQRLMHLIHDSKGASLCNKENPRIIGIPLPFTPRCGLIEVSDLAVFYVQSIAFARDGNGNLRPGVPAARLVFKGIGAIITDDLLEALSGIEGFRLNPTPAALNRALFLDPQPSFITGALEPATCNEGGLYTTDHADTLMAWELNGFYDQVRPIAQAFVDHGAEDLFVDLLATLHTHYPSRDSLSHQHLDPARANYAFASDLVSYEPLMAKILADGDVLGALVAGAPVLNGIRVNGKSGTTLLTNAGRYVVNPLPGLTKRNGDATTTTDDGRPVATLSPWYVIADANQDKLARLTAAPTEGAAWRGAMANTVDVLLRGEPIVDADWRFRNPRLRGVSVALLDFLESRLRAYDGQGAGARRAWLREELPRKIEDLVANPVFAGAADFVVSLQADADARQQLESLLAYLVNEVANTEVFWTALYAAADILQLALDDIDLIPIAHVAGEAIRPQRGILSAQLELAKRVRLTDQNRTFEAILRNLFSSHRPGHTAVGDLLDGITEVNRANPYEDLGVPYTAADYRAAFRSVASFLGDERRGLRKFIQIIKGRNL